MRIAYDPQIFSVQKYGGISRYFARLANEMSLLGQEVGIFTPKMINEYLKKISPELIHTKGAMGLVSSIPIISRRKRRKLDDWIMEKRLIGWKPDLLHETYYHPKGVPSIQVATVVTVYDMIHERFSEMFGPNDTTTHNKRLAVERADHVICISEHTRKDLIEIFGVPSEKTSVVHLAYDIPKHDNESEGVHCKPFILYVGDRRGYKNFSKALQAYATSQRISSDFDFIAFGGPAFNAVELSLIQSLGLSSEQVRWETGSDESLNQHYQSAAVFLYPSLYEGFGLPPLEAMSLGCPVVASNTSSIPEVVGDAAELFDPHSVEAMTHALEQVLYDSERKAELIRLGMARLGHFSWRKCAEETLAVYQKIAD